jgi:hypothetical protein
MESDEQVLDPREAGSAPPGVGRRPSLLVLAGLLLAVLVGWEFYRTHLDMRRRGCWATQKILDMALEIYPLETGKTVPRVIPVEFWVEMHRQGYIPERLDRGDSAGCRFFQYESGVSCHRHGAFSVATRLEMDAMALAPSPREQLEAMGITDADLLAGASTSSNGVW